MPTLDDVFAGGGFAPATWGQLDAPPDAFASRWAPVADSEDLRRVLALPRRPQLDLTSPRAATLVAHVTDRLRRRWPDGRPYDGPCLCTVPRNVEVPGLGKGFGRKRCIKELLPVQAWALHEINLVGGLLGPIVVGGGKCGCASVEVLDYATGRRRSIAEPGALQVATFSQTLRIGGAQAFASGSKRCSRFTLADGTSAEFSDDHPVLTQRGYVNVGDLVVGSDFTAVAVEMPEPVTPTVASDDEVAFVAYMLSDGGCSQRAMSFTNMTPTVVSEWLAITGRLGYGVREGASRGKARQFWITGGKPRANSGDRRRHEPDRIRERWDLHGLAKHKRTHVDLWGLPRAQVALFVNRFWACDGHVQPTRGVELTLASEKLIDDMRAMLLRLGVRSRKQIKPTTWTHKGVRKHSVAWRITCYGASALKFLDEIGDVLGKEDRCRELRRSLEATSRNANRDVVPVDLTIVQEICDELGMQGRGGALGRGRPRRDVRRFLGGVTGNVARARFVEFCRRWNYSGKYAYLATTDVAWERVTAVESIGVQPVYDLSVPGTHNFVANGVVVHNSFLDLLAPLAMPNCRLAVALVPPSLAKQLEGDYNLLRQHFRVPRIEIHGATPSRSDGGNEPMLHVLPYSMLSQPKSSDWLKLMQPDAIIADETHLLKDPTSARTRRVLRYFAEFGHTRFCGWSGSITDSSLQDYAHLSALALRYGSPLPLDPLEVENWGRAIDASDSPSDPGALLDGLVETGCCQAGEHVHDGYRRRFVETLGVVATTASAVNVDLVIEEKQAPPIPQEIRDYITQVRDTMVRPDGEELTTPLEVAKCARELACGFYYYWRFVNGETPDMVTLWRNRRRDFHRELREKLKDGAEFLDSPSLCEMAAQRACGQRPKRKDRPDWVSRYWLPWCEVKDTVRPITEATRVNDYLVRDAATWARNNRGIIWYDAREVGAWIAELSRLPQHTGGKGATERIDAEDGSRSIIASISSHGTGRDGLQHKFCDQLIIQFPSSAVQVEQWLGRLVRTGQEEERVRALYYGHTKELAASKAEAMRRANYVQRSTGIAQLLNAAR